MSTPKSARLESFTLDLDRQCLQGPTGLVDLRRKSFEVLRYLVEHAGRGVTKEEVLEAVWPDVTVGADSLTQCISEARRAIGDASHRIIKTVPRRGYLLNGTPTRPEAAASLVAARDPRPSLVVLPFQYMGDDPEQAYFADGLTEDLIDGLSRIGAVVIARGTAFTYQGRSIDVRQVGRELGVRYVIEGSVRRSNGQVRVTAELVDAPSTTNVWSETFDIDRRDLTRLRDEITARLANVLNLGLVRAENARSLRERPQDPEAWDLLVRARAVFYRSARGSDVSEPRRLFREALERDASLSEAWIGLSLTYLHNVRLSPTREQDLLLADDAAERAMALDQGARSHLVRGWVRYEQKRLELALAEFEHGVRLNPNLPLGHVMIGAVNVLLGQAENALEPMHKAMRLSPMDPALPYWQMFMGSACLHLQRDREAVEWLNRSLALNPRFPVTHLFLASALALCGREAQAKRAIGELLHLEPEFTLGRLKALELSETPAFRAQRERVYVGLCRAGLPE